MEWLSVYDSDNTSICFGKVRIAYFPSCKPYDADLINPIRRTNMLRILN